MSNFTDIYRAPMVILTLAVIIVALAVKYVDYRFNQFQSSLLEPVTKVRREVTPAERAETLRIMTERQGSTTPMTAAERERISQIMMERDKDIPELTPAERAEIERVMRQRN